MMIHTAGGVCRSMHIFGRSSTKLVEHVGGD